MVNNVLFIEVNHYSSITKLELKSLLSKYNRCLLRPQLYYSTFIIRLHIARKVAKQKYR